MKTFSLILFVGLVAAVMAVPLAEGAYPEDPTADIAWLSSCGYSGVTSIQCAFNNARSAENYQLGTSVPALTLPSPSTWDAMSDADKALWLTNRERIDRGVDPLEGTEVNVTGVAETYANYMLDDDCWGHECDGRTPWERLADNPAIGACHDFLSVAENLAALRASGGSIPLPVEQSVYMWMYQDKAISWGHRHTILWYPYNDNSGGAGMEGFLGIGRASGSWQSYPVAEIIVMNVFDPCASWGDADGDGITDDEDNCPMNDNPAQADMDGDCIGDACDPEPEVYDPSVPDITPPGGNGCGDACECHADCDSDGKIQLTDLVIMKQQFTWICSEHLSCETDCNYSGKVDLADLVIMKYEFMRTDCPVCP